ncbi:MAG TPA: hypothetical protein V6D50_20685 [Chroococcales cyanobacterium]
MNLLWRRIVRLPQTYLLLIGIGLGYLCFIVWLGSRPVVLVSGGVIALVAIASWLWQFTPKPVPPDSAANLLNREIFLSEVAALEQNIPNLPQLRWEQARSWAERIHGFAQRIAEREPTLTPELLEALNTVLDLLRQVVEGLQVTEQIQTSTYRHLAQQRLQASCARLRETHDQFQQLQDQIALSTLEQGTSVVTSTLPKRLQVLIADNKTTLQSPTDESSPPSQGG